jgi:hypothetical protein
MTQEELMARLAGAPVLTAVTDGKTREELESFLKSDACLALWGLMLGAKQAQLVALSKAPLTNMETVSRAAVLQGTIMGIELFYDTLLEQTVPSSEQEQN